MKHAFSLVELSIVLVILGLLTGGILAGQSLIKAAQLRGVQTEYSRYITAMGSFRDKYFALPGDMANATSFWGTDAGGCPGTSATTTGPGTATCNGNGDGQILSISPTSNEGYRIWQHLAAAGLIEGSYTGVPNTTVVGVYAPSFTVPNVPTSKMPNGLWTTVYSALGFPTSTTGNLLLYGAVSKSVLPFLIPEDAWNIDTKMDDGKPGTGRVTSQPGQANATTGCSDTAAAGAVYLLSNTAVSCSLAFQTSF